MKLTKGYKKILLPSMFCVCSVKAPTAQLPLDFIYVCRNIVK